MNVDVDGYLLAKPVPKPLWPPEDRINQTLGVGEGLKGLLTMRVAQKGDVKRRGAKNKSEFYRKHGDAAGKDPLNNVLRTAPNWRDEDEKRRLLDAELDDLQGRDETELANRISSPEPDNDYDVPVISRMRADAVDADVRSGARKRSRREKPGPASLSDRITSPPSKMRADYVDGSGLSLLERTSLARASADDLAYEGQGGREWDRNRDVSDVGSGRRGRRRRGGKDRGRTDEVSGSVRPSKTSQQLDDELDAFLRGGD